MSFKIKYIFTLALICYNLSYSQTGWVALNSGTTDILYSVFFTDSNTGYVTGGRISPSAGVVLKTTNGGSNWFQVLSVNDVVRGIYFVNSLTGTVVGHQGIIRKTTNGGLNWFNQIAPNNPTLFSIFMLNENVGCITGAINLQGLGTILYTSDGGNNWLNRSFGGDNMFYDSYFFDGNTGFVVGGSFPFSVLKTTNAGLNWIGSFDPYILYGISALDQNNIVCSGYFKTIIKTTNSGTNWITINQSSSPAHLNSIKYHDINNITSVGDSGIILRTMNGGSNWVQLPSGVNSHLNKVFFINSQTGWICGNNGVILKTTTGGVTFIQPISNEIPTSFSLGQNYPNPFNPSTKINFNLPKPSFTRLKIYDVYGREASMLVNEELKAGVYEIEWNGTAFSSGVYFYSLEASGFKQTMKMVLVK